MEGFSVSRISKQTRLLDQSVYPAIMCMLVSEDTPPSADQAHVMASLPHTTAATRLCVGYKYRQMHHSSLRTSS